MWGDHGPYRPPNTSATLGPSDGSRFIVDVTYIFCKILVRMNISVSLMHQLNHNLSLRTLEYS